MVELVPEKECKGKYYSFVQSVTSKRKVYEIMVLGDCWRAWWGQGSPDVELQSTSNNGEREKVVANDWIRARHLAKDL